jgi:hypothetical protein
MVAEVDAARLFRSSTAWKRVRLRVFAAAKRGKDPCAICGGALDWDAPRYHRNRPAVDHITPLRTIDLTTPEGRRLALDPTQLRIAHAGCNSARENASRARLARGLSPVMSLPARRSDEPEPALSDCNATWNRARADLHLWVAGHCPDPERCPRSRRAAEAARVPARTERLGNHSYWKGN